MNKNLPLFPWQGKISNSLWNKSQRRKERKKKGKKCTQGFQLDWLIEWTKESRFYRFERIEENHSSEHGLFWQNITHRFNLRPFLNPPCKRWKEGWKSSTEVVSLILVQSEASKVSITGCKLNLRTEDDSPAQMKQILSLKIASLTASFDKKFR